MVCIDQVASALVEGANSAALLNAGNDELTAIVRLGIPDGSQMTPTYCTGTVIGDGVILTAGHCLTTSPIQIDVLTGDVSSTVTVDNLVLHPNRDLALVRYVTPTEWNDVVPPIPTLTMPAVWTVGTPVQIAGYGDTPPFPRTTANFAVEELIDVSEDTVAVSSFGFSGACGGDSGGPLLTRTEDGLVRVAAVLTGGHVSCRAQDLYLRLDAVLDWLEGNGAIPSGPVTGVCGRITTSGRCYGDLAIYCQANHLIADVCSSGEACGWSSPASGYRCVAPEDDSCKGIDDLGSCENEVASYCAEGKLQKSECGLCGGSCVRSPKTGRTTCFRSVPPLVDAGTDH